MVGWPNSTSYLYSLGHRRVGYIGHHAALGPINERIQSLRDATGKYPGLEVDTATDADTLEGGRQAARVLLARSPRPTALVCVNDVMAVGALREARARGLRVPEDLSVTGFDNVTLAQFAVPALTTVHIPREQIGRTICACLMRDDVPREQEFVVEPELVVRDSTGLAPR